MASHTGWQRISEHLFMFEDTCNVYALVECKEAVLIDLGSGAALGRLNELGVERVRAILHTHHHRDQCQGDPKAAAHGIPIWVPEHERHLFEHAELYWAHRQLYDLYNVRNTLFSLTQDVPVAGSLEDFAEWKWGSHTLAVLPTPGHSVGSLTLVGTIDGQRVAFTGDLLYAPGKVVTLYDMQCFYGSFDGVEMAIVSLANLKRRQVRLICPAHGRPMTDTESALTYTRDLLARFYTFITNGARPVDEAAFEQTLPHVISGNYACSTFHAIIADDGHALLVDFGSPGFQLFAPVQRYFEDGERVRFVEHSLHRLQSQFGVKEIDAVMPSHYHDDHVNGIPYLQRQLGVPCWAYENMREILENPPGEVLGCVSPEPIRVDRTFRDGERFAWKGIEFTVHYAPGHADYHMAMFAQIDGHQVAFSGDNVQPTFVNTPSVIYRNHVHKTSHQYTASLYLKYMPDMLFAGHSVQRNVSPDHFRTFALRAEELTRYFEALLPGEANFGLEPSWTQVYPYQSVARPGNVIELQVRMRNFLDRSAQAEVSLVLPASWTAEPGIARIDLRAGERGVAAFKVRLPESYVFRYPRVAIAAEVTFDGRHLGQIAEATVEEGR